MQLKNKHSFWVLRILLVVSIMGIEHRDYNMGFAMAIDVNRGSFPKGFVFGTASSAYQYEGAVKEDGRGSCVWDKFAHSFDGDNKFGNERSTILLIECKQNSLLECKLEFLSKGKTLDFSNADVAEDHYHRYIEDIGLMKDMGMDSYRFSISWTRIFPNGSGQINQAGVDFYNNLIDALLAKGIEPYVTIFHWDTPQALEDRYDGWLSPQIINDFGFYADTLFEKFGDRVKHWITLNEPHNFAINGYDVGIAAPGRCSILLHLLCRAGNSATEPYIVAHNLLLSHATAAHIYREKYQRKQGGSIGAAFDVIWYEPDTNTTDNIEATQRAMDFQLGWFLDPIMFGDYPSSMRKRVGERLPAFSEGESVLVKGSLDFVGINHYTTYFAKDSKVNLIGMVLKDAQSDSGSTTSPIGHDLKPIGDKANSIWLYIVPWGMRRLTNYIKTRYGNPTVIITENGMDDPNVPLMPRSLILKDNKRIRYHNDYLQNLAAAINEDGCNVKGYFAWSLLDNWEWAAGYSSRFGLYYVDRNDNLNRYPKNSALWFKAFLNSSTN